MSYEIRQIDPLQIPQGLAELLLITQQPEVQMLPLTEGLVAMHKQSWCAFMQEDEVAGYIAQTREYTNRGLIELGGLVVDPKYRGRGIGLALVAEATKDTLQKSESTPIAFCNPLSDSLFQAAGYKNITNGEVPTEAYSFCCDCRKQPESGCCDKVFALDPETVVELRR